MATDPLLRGKKDNSNRRYSGGGPRPDRADTKRVEAQEHLVAWAALSPKQQLAALDTRLGKGVGAKRQRARIEKQLAASAVEQPAKPKASRSQDRR